MGRVRIRRALDAERASARQDDYKFRVPGPVLPPRAESEKTLLPRAPSASLEECDVYLHMKKTSTGLERGRALVGFVLAEIAKGDEKDMLLSRRRGDWSARQALDWAARADSYNGQAWALGEVLVSLARRAPELHAAAEDRTEPDEARLIETGRKRGAPTEEDWALVKTSRIDPRTAWARLLFFSPPDALPAVTSRLKQTLPLHDDMFAQNFLQGPRPSASRRRARTAGTRRRPPARRRARPTNNAAWSSTC